MHINEFSGKYAFLSNFWSCKIMFEGIEFPTVEHAFQAAKTTNPNEREMVRLAPTPVKAKRIGRKVTLRDDWEKVKIEIMRGLLVQKFSQDEMLREMLLSTGDWELIEGNTWGDKFWGAVLENGKWVGRNELGKLLMSVRSQIRAEVKDLRVIIAGLRYLYKK
jgi:N-glycosidase YbiA